VNRWWCGEVGSVGIDEDGKCELEAGMLARFLVRSRSRQWLRDIVAYDSVGQVVIDNIGIGVEPRYKSESPSYTRGESQSAVSDTAAAFETMSETEI
jgi:hypothetical protein